MEKVEFLAPKLKEKYDIISTMKIEIKENIAIIQ